MAQPPDPHQSPPLSPPAPPSRDEILAAFANRARRDFIPIRHTFVQSRNPTGPGPLAEVVRRRDNRGLDLFLLCSTITSQAPFNVTLDAVVWARAIGLDPDSSGLATLSKTFRRLEGYGLISRERSGRRLKITRLQEDGSGSPYTRPTGKGDVNRFFKLDHAYWQGSERWYLKLDLPAKAMLLVALSLTDHFVLPYSWAPRWYGLSADTARRGLRQLKQHGLIDSVKLYKPAPLSPKGYTEEWRWTLQPPFGPLGFSALAGDTTAAA